MMNERVRRLSIPECITLATQRLTKYPLLFEAILKGTKGMEKILKRFQVFIVKTVFILVMWLF